MLLEGLRILAQSRWAEIFSFVREVWGKFVFSWNCDFSQSGRDYETFQIAVTFDPEKKYDMNKAVEKQLERFVALLQR